MFSLNYDDIITLDNLLLAWQNFHQGKKYKTDVLEFEHRLMDNLLSLHINLKKQTYIHGGYQAFKINDPKPRDIHKASVRDRVLHYLLYQSLYLFFDRQFIYDSYSCRKTKGTHKALKCFTKFARKVSQNQTKTVWVLKCDIKKFFASIDHLILKNILAKTIPDRKTLDLLTKVIDSFDSGKSETGLPLGNLTSQLLVNIYMNEFDQFIKHKLKAKYYIRYADDFVIFSTDKQYLLNLLPAINLFLQTKLKLTLHPNKVFIKTLASGVDFLGWVYFPTHKVFRTNTKRRMFKNIKNSDKEATLLSYLGLLKHGNGWRLQERVKIM